VSNVPKPGGNFVSRYARGGTAREAHVRSAKQPMKLLLHGEAKTDLLQIAA
jgi:hypothetical protein